jgi:hypothetical protein
MTSICAGCKATVTWNGAELVDADGTPHRLTCRTTHRNRRLIGLRRTHCPTCQTDTSHEITQLLPRGHLLRCQVCLRARQQPTIQTRLTA